MIAPLTRPGEAKSSSLWRLRHEDADTAASFVTALDDQTRQMRFHRFTTAAMVRAHYDALDWEAAVVTAWVADGTVRGLSEVLLYVTPQGLEAEIALCVAGGWTGRGVGDVLMAHAAGEAARRGAWRSIMVIACGDHEHAAAARRLGATLDARQGLTVLVHAPATDRDGGRGWG